MVRNCGVSNKSRIVDKLGITVRGGGFGQIGDVEF